MNIGIKRSVWKSFYLGNITKPVPPLNGIHMKVQRVILLIRLFKNAFNFFEEALSRCYKQNNWIAINDNYRFTWLSNMKQFPHCYFLLVLIHVIDRMNT